MEETPPRFCQSPFHPAVDPGFRLRGRNFKHAPWIVFFLGEIDFSVENVSTDACDAGDTERGIDFSKVSNVLYFTVVEFSDVYREERINTGLKW